MSEKLKWKADGWLLKSAWANSRKIWWSSASRNRARVIDPESFGNEPLWLAWDAERAAQWLREKQESVAVYASFYEVDLSLARNSPGWQIHGDEMQCWLLQTWRGWPSEETLLFVAPTADRLRAIRATQIDAAEIGRGLPSGKSKVDTTAGPPGVRRPPL